MSKLSLSKALRAKKKALGLSDAKLAKTIGISVVALTGVLSGKREPNARTAGKYAKFLGAAMPKAAKPTKKAKAGRKPGRRGPGRPKGNGKASGALSKAAKALAKDKLAAAVHQAPKKLRKIIGILLKTK